MRRYPVTLLFILVLVFILLYLVVFRSYKKEPFTPKIKQTYRPYFRGARMHYDTFKNYVTTDNVILKLKKWNIY